MKYDLVVIGGGIVGLTSAYHFARQFGGRILIVDAQPGPAQGNTARSVGGFRMGLFTSKVNRLISETTVRFYLDVQNSGYDLGIHQVGYLILLDEARYDQYVATVRELFEAGTANLLPAADLKEMIGFIELDLSDEESELLGLKPIKGAIFSPYSGYLDVEKLARFYYEELVKMGVDFLFNTRVEKLTLAAVNKIGHPREPFAWQEKRIEFVESSNGTFEADTFILAAGAWTQELLDPIGIDSYIKPKKRQVFAAHARGDLEAFFNVQGFNSYGTLPMTFIPRGPFVVPRVRDRSIWMGLSDDIGRKWGIDFEAEDIFYYDNVYPLLRKIFPIIEGARPMSKWAGCYSINSIDENPVAFRVMNLVVATGGSGSGVMKADSLGRIAAALALGRQEAELYGGTVVPSTLLGIKGRSVEPELLVF
ncbi:MAG: FAD-binding oxidoreductase [Nitrososphaerota archaeon]